MKTQRTICRASVHPHRHTNETGGPLDLKIGLRSQPPTVQCWTKGRAIRIRLEQPDDRTNLTIIQLAFDLKDPRRDGVEKFMETQKWYNINQYRIKKSNSLTCYLKTRITKTMQHPIPRGRWEGTCVYDYRQCTFTFQAMTMKVQPEESRIIVPDGSFPASKRRIIIP
ncbi:hypothetical protein LCGC14_3136320 [marine sediment metagenome]|uniref:Uncharacterized protein n=1 Tax=marine sediment metagenome TaxID=412755 RepID=A0A0F8VY65_9ZZZZ